MPPRVDDHLKKKFVRRQMACKYCFFHTGCRVAVPVAGQQKSNQRAETSLIQQLFSVVGIFFLVFTSQFSNYLLFAGMIFGLRAVF